MEGPTPRLLLLHARDEDAGPWSDALSRDGFRVELSDRDSVRADDIVRRRPDLVLLDMAPPREPVLRLCRRLRSDPRSALLPIVLIAARRAEADRAVGLAAGADDCLPRPVTPALLSSRVGRVLRRRGVLPSSPDIRVGPIAISPTRHRVYADGRPVGGVTYIEFRILQALAESPGRALTRSQLLKLTHADRAGVSERSVDVHVVGLRRKLGRIGARIESVRTVGYRLSQEPHEEGPPPGHPPPGRTTAPRGGRSPAAGAKLPPPDA
jgi:two-component system phosphate regulon response regulator PhoB